MKILCIMAMLATLLCGCASESGAGADRSESKDVVSRETRLVNKGWTFHLGAQDGAEAPGFDDSSWEQVNLPHSASIPYWMELEVYEGDTWYRKEFAVDADLKSRWGARPFL